MFQVSWIDRFTSLSLFHSSVCNIDIFISSRGCISRGGMSKKATFGAGVDYRVGGSLRGFSP